MNTLPNDILIRETPGGTTVWVSQRLVVERCGVSEKDLRAVHRFRYKNSLPESWQSAAQGSDFLLGDSGKSWRWGRKGGQYYYDVDRIPNRKPCYYRDQLPAKDELIIQVDENHLRSSRARKAEQRKLIQEQVLQLVDNQDIFYYMNYELGDRCIFNRDKAHELTMSVAWCKFLKRAIATSEYSALGFASQDDFFVACADILAQEDLEGFRVKTAASVRKKAYSAPQEYDDLRHYVVSQKYGNDNPRKLGKYHMVDRETGELIKFDEHQVIIMDYWLNPGGTTKGTKIELWRQYCHDMSELGMNPVSLSTFTHYTNTFVNKFKGSKERHGVNFFKNTYKTYTPAKKLEYANSLWASDGSGVVPYRYQDHYGKWRMMKLYTMLVSDVASKYIAGYSVSRRGQHVENFTMLRSAMVMALKNNGITEVMDFISDNHGAYTSAESKRFLQLACREYRTIEAGNSQANPAETLFRLFKRRFKRYFKLPETSWEAKSLESMANPDYYNIMSLPTYSESLEMLDKAINEWNVTPLTNGITPTEWFTHKNPEAKEYDGRQYRMITGEVSNVDISYMRGFVNVERQGVEYKFEIPDLADVMGLIAEHMGYSSSVPVTAYWSEDMADIYTRDGVYMFSCTNAMLAAKSHSEAGYDSYSALAHHSRRSEVMEEMADRFVEDIVSAREVLSPNYQFNISNGVAKEDYNEMQEAISAEKWSASLAKKQTKEAKREQRESNQVTKELLLQQQRYIDQKFDKVDTF